MLIASLSCRDNAFVCPVAPRLILAQARAARGIRRAHGSICARPRHQNPEIAKPASKGGSAIPAGAGKTRQSGDTEIPLTSPNFRKPLWRAPAKCAQNQPLPGGLRCNPGGYLCSKSSPFPSMPSRPCQPAHRWLLTCFSRYVDRAGKAFPSLRQLARDARMSLASVSRYMTALEQLEVFHRQRRPGGRYVYQLAEAYRPRWPGRAGRGVSAVRQGVSKAETTEQAEPRKHREGARVRARFAKPGISFGEIPDERAKWDARLRSWRNRGFGCRYGGRSRPSRAASPRHASLMGLPPG